MAPVSHQELDRTTRPLKRIISLLEARERADEGASTGRHGRLTGIISTDTLPRFQHINAASVEEAVSLLNTFGERARVIAGGTDLLLELKCRVWTVQPRLLVNIKSITRSRRMDYVEVAEGGLRIGSTATLREVETDPEVRASYSLLAQAAHAVGTPQRRNMATLGGDLCQHVRCWYYKASGNAYFCVRKGGDTCFATGGDNRYHAMLGFAGCHAVCPSETAIALTALDARVVAVGPLGQRSIAVQDFFTPLGNVLASNEVVTEIRVPQPEAGTRCVLKQFRMRNALDPVVVSVAAKITLEGQVCVRATIVLGGVSPMPWRASAAEHILAGETLSPSLIEATARAAVMDATPLSKNGYKVDLAKALVKRALSEIA
ncbi:MAG: xanthine dehydrogenase family protein subunit M [Chloroflexi bacterium]|nr:xanthine dehydrogenase family protein subunit M [Chloroflexota bacterium]